MKTKKLIAFVLIVAMFAALSAQTVTRTETTAEADYLSSFQDVIITELAVSDNYDNKVLALQHIEDALDSASSSRDLTQILDALDSLAGEGIITQSRTNGRLANNFPDVRAKACELLAKTPTEEARNTLLKISLADNEPMVVSSAVRSLGSIGFSNAEVIQTIAWVEKKYALVNPTSSLANEILATYEKLGTEVEDKVAMIQSITAIATNYNYVTPVRERAVNLLKQYSGTSSSSPKK